MVFALTISGIAAPPSKTTHFSSPLARKEAFESLKPGDKVALVCTQCQSVNVQTVQDKADAMKLCKEGDSITCPSCKKTLKIVRQGVPGKNATPSTKVVYVNEKGEECMFIAKLNE